MTHSPNGNGTIQEELGGKYFTFKLGNEEYGVDILKVREIIGLMSVTEVPRTPEHVRGVINLRGKIIPVLDMRLKFGLPETPDTEETCIIVIDINHEGTTAQIGAIVDSVCEVADISGSDIEYAPLFGGNVECRFIRGIAKMDDSVKILLEIEDVLTANDMQNAGNDVNDSDG